jgi:hypothetical protein
MEVIPPISLTYATAVVLSERIPICNDFFDSSEFDSTGVKLYIFIHNEVRDFDNNSTQPEIRVNRIRDNESQLY